jgi:AraC-like DNA-binding protein
MSGHAEAAAPATVVTGMPRLWGVDPSATLDACPGSGIAAARMKVAGRRAVASPAMRDVHIVSWVLAGEARHEIWNDERQVYSGPVPDRTINIVRAGVAPRALIARSIDVLHIYVPNDLLVGEALHLGRNASSVELIDPRSRPDPIMGSLAEALLAGMTEPSQVARLFSDHIGHAIALHLLRGHSNLANLRLVETRKGGLAPWQEMRVSDYLQDHLSEDVSLAELAGLIGLTSFHLCRAFKASTGLPPHRWRQQRRMERARELLETSELSVGEIAAAVGYAEPSPFAAAFRKAYGASPSAYRRTRRL